ncbi:hypothetical protein [Vibrio harveyi]|uniref:hypothetical protein n=1 Tax=Vibrio harveyi TaxID=669 RepID=UPI00238065F8|nr:hypothetical protein [Vibrio harveyi]
MIKLKEVIKQFRTISSDSNLTSYILSSEGESNQMLKDYLVSNTILSVFVAGLLALVGYVAQICVYGQALSMPLSSMFVVFVIALISYLFVSSIAKMSKYVLEQNIKSNWYTKLSNMVMASIAIYILNKIVFYIYVSNVTMFALFVVVMTIILSIRLSFRKNN